MEKHLLMRNKRHLQQMSMEDSPPSQAYFHAILDNYGTSSMAHKLLDGEITNELDNFPPVIRTWLQQFQRTDDEKASERIDGFIHPHEFQNLFASVKERTASSPSGVHYTFWKSMAMDDDMAGYLCIMMRLPFMHGFKNDRWTHCLDVMLEKKPGVRRIHQLRIIGLVEADFNTALKFYFAKHLVANS